MKAITMRDYQVTDDQNIESAWKEHRSVLYQLPIGGGKSIIIQKSIQRYKGEQILVLAHKRRLLIQLRAHLANIGVKAGVLGGGFSENLDANILIVSIRTAVKEARLEWLLKRKWDRVYIDEARHSRTGSYDTVLDALKEAHPTHKLLGVDATPYRKDKKRLDKHFDWLVTSVEDVDSLINKGYLAKFKVYASPIGDIVEQVKEVANDYQQVQLSDYMRQQAYLDYVVKMYKDYGEDRQAICFAVDKAHAKDLKAAFIKGGVPEVEQIDSDMDDSEIDRIITSYEAKKTKVLINIEMLTEGVDLPDTSCIIGARPTKSLTLYLQMVGRGTRPKSDGSMLIVLDCAGWTDEFGALSSKRHWSLNPEIDPNNPRKKNKVVGRTADGKFVEDISDFLGELVEMTPEEYIGTLSGGIDKAKAINASLEDKMSDLIKAIGDLFRMLAKNSNDFHQHVELDINDNKMKILYMPKETYGELYQKAKWEAEGRGHGGADIDKLIRWDYAQHIEIDLSKDALYPNYKNMPIGGWRSNPTKEELRVYFKLIQLLGSFGKIFDTNEKNTLLKVENLKEELFDLKSSRVNIKELEQVAQQAESKNLEQIIRNYAKENGVFELQNPIWESDYFKGTGSGKIVKIEVKSIASYHNKIKVTLLFDKYNYQTGKREPYTEVVDKNYVKGEKLIEMIMKGKWEPVKEMI